MPSGIKLLTDDQSKRLNRVFKGNPHILPPTLKDCFVCQGTRTFRWYSQYDPTVVVDYHCNCEEQRIMHRSFLYHGIGRNFQTLGWRDFNGDPESMRFVQAYIAEPGEYFRHGLGMRLWGEIGTGKSLLGALVLKAYIAEGYNGFFTTFNEL